MPPPCTPLDERKTPEGIDTKTEREQDDDDKKIDPMFFFGEDVDLAMQATHALMATERVRRCNPTRNLDVRIQQEILQHAQIVAVRSLW